MVVTMVAMSAELKENTTVGHSGIHWAELMVERMVGPRVAPKDERKAVLMVYGSVVS